MRLARMLLVMLFAAAFVVAAAGDDPWDGETASWDKKTADKILNNSPWARRIPTRVDYAKEDLRTHEATKRTGQFDRGEMQPTDFAIVWWWSARTPRRAYLRMLELNGNIVTPEDREGFAEAPMPNPAISVLGGGNMVDVSGMMSAEELKAAAWLETPRSKKVMPLDVKIFKDHKDKPERIIFIFPEQVEGQPLVTSQDKRILFRFKLPKSPRQKIEDAQQFEAQFEPKKMVARGTQDL